MSEVVASVIDALANASAHLHFHAKERLPGRFHYVHSERIAPIIGLCDEHWVASNAFTLPDPASFYFSRGTHGYDPQLPSMAATFIASGRAFRSAYDGAPARFINGAFASVDIMNIGATVLGLTAPANNGTLVSSDVLFGSSGALLYADSSSAQALPSAHACTASAPTLPPLTFDMRAAAAYRDARALPSPSTLHLTCQVYVDALVGTSEVWSSSRVLTTSDVRGSVSADGTIDVPYEPMTDPADNVAIPYCSRSLLPSLLTGRAWYQFQAILCAGANASCADGGEHYFASASLELFVDQ
jgi:hypothetical protein